MSVKAKGEPFFHRLAYNERNAPPLSFGKLCAGQGTRQTPALTSIA